MMVFSLMLVPLGLRLAEMGHCPRFLADDLNVGYEPTQEQDPFDVMEEVECAVDVTIGYLRDMGATVQCEKDIWHAHLQSYQKVYEKEGHPSYGDSHASGASCA